LQFIVYGVAGKSMLVDVEVGEEFSLEFEGVKVMGSIETDEKGFEVAVRELKSRYKEFQPVDEVVMRKFVFKGKVGDVEELLPAEPVEEFARRFVENHVVVLKG